MHFPTTPRHFQSLVVLAPVEFPPKAPALEGSPGREVTRGHERTRSSNERPEIRKKGREDSERSASVDEGSEHNSRSDEESGFNVSLTHKLEN